jgi:hypothetical protein
MRTTGKMRTVVLLVGTRHRAGRVRRVFLLSAFVIGPAISDRAPADRPALPATANTIRKLPAFVAVFGPEFSEDAGSNRHGCLSDTGDRLSVLKRIEVIRRHVDDHRPEVVRQLYDVVEHSIAS